MKYLCILWLLCTHGFTADNMELSTTTDNDHEMSEQGESLSRTAKKRKAKNQKRRSHKRSKRNPKTASHQICAVIDPRFNLDKMPPEIAQHIVQYSDFFKCYNLLFTSKNCRQYFLAFMQKIMVKKSRQALVLQPILTMLCQYPNDIESISIRFKLPKQNIRPLLTNKMCDVLAQYTKLKCLWIETDDLMTSCNNKHLRKLDQCTNLEQLCICSTELSDKAFTQKYKNTNNADEAEQSLLERLTSLQALVIKGGKEFSGEGFAAQLTKHIKLTKLNLYGESENPVGEHIVLQLPTTLESLGLSCRFVHNSGLIPHLATLPLQELTLKYPYEDFPPSADDYAKIFNLSSLTSLGLYNIDFVDHHLNDITKLTNLKTLSMGAPAQLGENSYQLLAQLSSLSSLCLQTFPNLTYDNLQHLLTGPLSTSLRCLQLIGINRANYVPPNNDPFDVEINDLVCKLTHLKQLHLINIAQFTNHGLNSLTALRNLKRVEINGCGLASKNKANNLSKYFKRKKPKFELCFTESYRRDVIDFINNFNSFYNLIHELIRHSDYVDSFLEMLDDYALELQDLMDDPMRQMFPESFDQLIKVKERLEDLKQIQQTTYEDDSE